MSNFNWQTEEENWDNWEDPIPPPPKRPRFRPSRRLITVILLTLLVAFTTTAVSLNRRFTTERDQRLQDALTAHKLLLTAADNGDSDLFVSLLEDPNKPSRIHLEQLARSDIFGTANYFNLIPAAPLTNAPILNTNINTLLDEVIIEVKQPYTHPIYGTIDLEQLYVYHLKDSRWLLVEPTDEFWGRPSAPLSSKYITILDYHERDKDFIERLLPEFDDTLSQFCQLPSANCHSDFQISIDFAHSLGLLPFEPPDAFEYRLTKDLFFEGASIMPVPSAIGRPHNEAAYQALKLGYTTQLLTSAIIDLTGYSCCSNHDNLHRAFLEQQLTRLDLQGSPLTLTDYDQYLTNPLPFTSAIETLNERSFNPDDLLQARLLAAYLLEVSNKDPLTLQYQLLADEPLGQLLNGRDPALLAADFATFVTTQSPANNAPPPQPFPTQTIETVCQTADTYTHYSYNPTQDRWQSLDVNPNAQLINLHILADDTGRLWDIRGGRGSTQQLTVQYDNQPPISIYETDNLSLGRLAIRWTHPNREKLTLVNVAPMRPTPSYATFDATSCPTGTCEVISSTGLPLWSPSGNQRLLLEEGILWVTNISGQKTIKIGPAMWPFIWLDDQTIAYAVPDPNSTTPGQIFHLDLNHLAPRTPLFDWSNLPLSSTAQGDWQITAAMPVPQRPNWLLLQRHYFYGNEAQTFLYNWQTREILTLPITNPFGYPHFSADGRWLVWQSRGIAPSYLINTANGSAITQYPAPTFINNNNTHFFDWSADGRWLLHLDEGFMRLTLPGESYTKIIPYPAGTHLCTSGGWLHTAPPSPEPIIIDKPTLPDTDYLR